MIVPTELKLKKKVGTRFEGFLYKNAAGKPFASGRNMRFFVAEGFHVQFFETDGPIRKRFGSFDFRNVSALQPSSDPGAAGGVDVVLCENPKSTKATKRITVSFAPEPSEREGWLIFFTSAVDEKVLDAGLKKWRDPYLSATLNNEFHKQETMLAKGRSSVKPLAPREPSELRLAPPQLDDEPVPEAKPEKPAPEPAVAVAPAPAPAAVPVAPALTEEQLRPPRKPAPPPAPAAAVVDDGDYEIDSDDEEITDLNFADESLLLPGIICLQKIARGYTLRQRNTRLFDNQESSVVRIQSFTRGYIQRYKNMEEFRRREWVRFLLLPEVARFDLALTLTLTKEEDDYVELMKQEHAWQLWVRYYLALGKVKQARKLGWNGLDPPLEIAPDPSEDLSWLGWLLTFFSFAAWSAYVVERWERQKADREAKQRLLAKGTERSDEAEAEYAYNGMKKLSKEEEALIDEAFAEREAEKAKLAAERHQRYIDGEVDEDGKPIEQKDQQPGMGGGGGGH